MIETPPPPMQSHDPLSDVLRSVRLRGAVFYYVSYRDEWVAEAPAAREIADAVMPGAEHVLEYHLIAKGGGWAATDGVAPVRLGEGDIVMFPRGDAHVMSSAPGLRAPPDRTDWIFATRNDPKPIPVSFHRGVLRPGAPQPADEATTVVVCGFIGCDLKPFNPLIDALPRLLHLPAGGVGDWVRGVLHQAVDESRQRRPGSAALLERVSEMVFVDAARRYLDALPEDAAGWLAGLRDRHVGKAIALLHQRPAEPWTLDALGSEVALSRSALHERFVRFVGLAPMQYLANWRMQLGAKLLRSSRATVAGIAQEVGYDSEAAFARAFKRATGVPPAAWRRRQAGDPAA
ncbi:MAG TPA: AraC family transcriptional regulator [Burkholderiaceae bacterium]|nr:AraC family transcriptional regulator [Burkholderiaceae bacterium]